LLDSKPVVLENEPVHRLCRVRLASGRHVLPLGGGVLAHGCAAGFVQGGVGGVLRAALRKRR